MSNHNNDIAEEVKAALNSKRVKLWLPPYHGNGTPNQAELQSLAQEMATHMHHTPNEILKSLLFWQTRSLKKQHNITIASLLQLKMLGLPETTKLDLSKLSTWAERVDMMEGKTTLQLHNVHKELTAFMVATSLLSMLEASRVRMVHKGKTLAPNARLENLVVGSHKKNVILCIVSYKNDTIRQTEQETLIASIRSAAARLVGSSGGFEITDQRGNLVAMKASERLAFLTALGLHRLGRKHMNNNNLSSALVFLLQADVEWNSKISGEWRDRVDNYGLLQLDICWLYLKLESLENLENVLERLNVAEVALRQQVHSNFVTLALTQADMDNCELVPPLAAIFGRLFLLQGIAHYHADSKIASRERLDWAWSLCRCLRSVSPDKAVHGLVEAMGVSKFEAIAALRRSHGNPNAAATLLEDTKMEAMQQRRRRQQEGKLGLCENGVNHVNLNVLQQLHDVLGLPLALGDSTSPVVVTTAGLLRLTNNDLVAALDLHETLKDDSETLHNRIKQLDIKQGVNRTLGRKRSRNEVDPMALGTLVSMGVDESLAKEALEQSENNVEMSLLWLTTARGGQNNTENAHAPTVPTTAASLSEEKDETRKSATAPSNHDDETDQVEEAELLLQRELGEALNERDLEKDYLGCSLDEEWNFLQQYKDAE